MRISSDYSNYYNRSYNINSLSKSKEHYKNTSASNDTSDAIGFPETRNSGGAGNIMNLSMSGMMAKYSLQSQDTSGMKEKMETMKSDMDSLRSADIDSMSADEVKSTLTKLKADMEAMPARPGGKTSKLQQADLDTMSESDMKDMLKNVQQHAKHRHERAEGVPQMMGGIDPSQILNGVTGSQDESDSTDSAANIQNMAMQLVDKLTGAYDSSSGSTDDYVSKLKESLQNLFSNQKNSIDQLSNTIFSDLDNWNSSEKTKTEAV